MRPPSRASTSDWKPLLAVIESIAIRPELQDAVTVPPLSVKEEVALAEGGGGDEAAGAGECDPSCSASGDGEKATCGPCAG